jgi:hypothetical protein
MSPPALTQLIHHNQPRLGSVGAESSRKQRSGCGPLAVSYPPVYTVRDKKVVQTNVLIPSTNACYLTIASSVFWGGALAGPYPTLRFGGACGRGVGAF